MQEASHQLYLPEEKQAGETEKQDYIPLKKKNMEIKKGEVNIKFHTNRQNRKEQIKHLQCSADNPVV